MRLGALLRGPTRVAGGCRPGLLDGGSGAAVLPAIPPLVLHLAPCYWQGTSKLENLRVSDSLGRSGWLLINACIPECLRTRPPSFLF